MIVKKKIHSLLVCTSTMCSSLSLCACLCMIITCVDLCVHVYVWSSHVFIWDCASEHIKLSIYINNCFCVYVSMDNSRHCICPCLFALVCPLSSSCGWAPGSVELCVVIVCVVSSRLRPWLYSAPVTRQCGSISSIRMRTSPGFCRLGMLDMFSRCSFLWDRCGRTLGSVSQAWHNRRCLHAYTGTFSLTQVPEVLQGTQGSYSDPGAVGEVQFL